MGYTKMSDEQIERMMAHHPPRDDAQAMLYQENRREFIALARSIRDRMPCNAEATLALRRLDEALFYANAAVARG